MTAPVAPTLGELVAASRQRAGLTLRGLSEALAGDVPDDERPRTLSTQFLHDVEHGRRELPVAWWKAFAEVLPGVTVRGLAEARVRAAGGVVVRLREGEMTQAQREGVVEALVREAGE